MPYIVTRQFPAPTQVTIDDILNDIDDQEIRHRHVTKGGTMTRIVDWIRPDIIRKMDIPRLIQLLKDFNESHAKLFEANRKSLYREFYIPKKSGGLRKIDAPNDELMAALRDLKVILENEFNMLYHTANYAYVKNRCTVDAVKRHQANASKWFLKTDFSNFFGSTTLEFLMRMMSMIFPFSEVVKVPEGKENLEKALSLAFLDGGLPQGTPLSPALTCAFMIPIDHKLANAFATRQMVYTRYADDILVSSKVDFKYREVVNYINKVVREDFGAPFMIKPEKTRYGSSSGRNWNLGVMLNADNEITIGHQKKKQFKAMINNYICDMQRGIQWDLNDVQVFRGLMSYYEMIEPEYINHVIIEYNKKYRCNLKKMIKEDLGGRHSAV